MNYLLKLIYLNLFNTSNFISDIYYKWKKYDIILNKVVRGIA